MIAVFIVSAVLVFLAIHVCGFASVTPLWLPALLLLALLVFPASIFTDMVGGDPTGGFILSSILWASVITFWFYLRDKKRNKSGHV